MDPKEVKPTLEERAPLGACHGSELTEYGQVDDTIRRW
jgi:hypothetical protein